MSHLQSSKWPMVRHADQASQGYGDPDSGHSRHNSQRALRDGTQRCFRKKRQRAKSRGMSSKVHLVFIHRRLPSKLISLYIRNRIKPATACQTYPLTAKLSRLARFRSGLSDIFALPHQLPLEHVRPARALPFQRSNHRRSTSSSGGTRCDTDEDGQPLLHAGDIVAGRESGLSEEEEEALLLRADALNVRMMSLDSGGLGLGGVEELSLYEKKSVLINRELDQMGMGRYQYLIFYLCGLGYFLDLLWAQVFSLVAGPIQAEMGVSRADIGWMYACFNTGLMAGALGWGMAVDVIGRRWCFNLTCLITTVFGTLFAFPSSFFTLCIISCGVGVGVGGNIPIDATIVIEFLPKNRRYLLAALSTFLPLGSIVSALIAWAIIPRYSCAVGPGLPCSQSENMGWRYTILTIAFITAFIFLSRFAIFNFRESPKFLLSMGHDAHALDVLYAIAKFNGTKPPGLSMEDFQALEFGEWSKSGGDLKHSMVLESASGGASLHKGESSVQRYFTHLRGMFRNRAYAYIFTVLALAYTSLFFSFSIAGGFLPLILAAKGVETKMTQSQTYRSYVIIHLPGVTASWLAAIAMELPRLGRKWAMILAAGMMGMSLIAYQLVISINANIACNALEYWCQSLYTALLYAYTPEAFPTTYRGSASGMLSTLGRIAGIIAPVVAGKVYTGGDSPGVLYLAGGAAWVSMLAIACLPFGTKGKEVF